MSSLEDFQRAQREGTTVGHEWARKQEEAMRVVCYQCKGKLEWNDQQHKKALINGGAEKLGWTFDKQRGWCCPTCNPETGSQTALPFDVRPLTPEDEVDLEHYFNTPTPLPQKDKK